MSGASSAKYVYNNFTISEKDGGDDDDPLQIYLYEGRVVSRMKDSLENLVMFNISFLLSSQNKFGHDYK